MTRRLVVTGVDGFVGRHLARIAAESGMEVFGISRSPEADADLLADLAGYTSTDLRREWPEGIPADSAVIHLAGLAAVGASFDRPQEYIEGNSAIVTNMCESLVASGFTGRVVGVSTGAVYAQKPDDPARSELDPVAFTSPYVVSKILVENQLAYYSRRGLRTVVARPFNHIGPHQGPGFLLPDLLRRLRTAPHDQPLRVGNLATRRDYTDVRDVARAYLTLATTPELAHDVQRGLGSVAFGAGDPRSTVGRDRPAHASIDVDESLVRATDPPVIVGDSSRLRSDTGWSPEIGFGQTIADTVAASL